MAQCLIRSGVRVVTADMTVRFFKPAPLEQPLTIRGFRVGGRKNLHFTQGTVSLPDGTVVASAEGRYAEC
jgi:acyl-coenzyme A thioesterase PaaI-like protein